MEVKFKNVGRDNKSWVAKINGSELTYNFLYRQARKVLLSKYIDFCFTKNDTRKGVIVVGGFREVGEFEVIDKEQKK